MPGFRFPLPALLLSFFFLALHPAIAQEREDSVKNVLTRFMDQWHLDAAEGHHAAYIGAMSPEGVYIGTDASERWTTAGFSRWSKPWFDRHQTWAFKTVSRNIFLSGDGSTAWFDELLSTKMGLCRGSGVISKRAGGWKIEQYILSATVPNALMRQVTSLKSGNDSLLTPYLRNGIMNPQQSLDLKPVFEESKMTGTILIFDPEKKEYYGYDPAKWDSGYLPASTFKIVNTLIGLETGAIDTGHVFRWNGEKRRLPQWNQDLRLKEAFAVSCVPCYQEVARSIGYDRMKQNLEKLGYGSMDVHPGNIDLFWLEGNSRITPRQQVDFIRRLYTGKLPLSRSTIVAVKEIMLNESGPGYTLSGKTGWAVRNSNNYGWFVGYLEAGKKVWFFATMVEPLNRDDFTDFAGTRKEITLEAFRRLGFINAGQGVNGLPKR